MYIINLDSVDGESPGVGRKAVSLGILSKAGFAVPQGFVVTTGAFEKFLTDTGIGLSLPGILAGVNPEEPETAFRASGQIRDRLFGVSGNDFLIRELKGAYNELSFGKDVSSAGGAALDLIRAGRGNCFVSVRPSVACGKTASFAGHGKASLNVMGYRQVVAAVKDCWLSAFRPEALVYRKIQGIEEFSMAVIVQRMVDSELSGTLFTQEPVSGGDRILVEGFWGLGETLCCGCLSPDRYLIEKGGSLVSGKVARKLWLRRRGPLSGNTIQEKVPASRVTLDTLVARDFPKFSQLALRTEELLKGPQHLEWGVDRGRIVILQASPILSAQPAASESSFRARERLFSGLGVSGGSASGKAVVWKDSPREGEPSYEGYAQEIRKPPGPAILVTKSLSMDILPYIRWFSGIVSEQGGTGSCLASVGREKGIPMVAGFENASLILRNGQDIMIDGYAGDVYVVPAQAGQGP